MPQTETRSVLHWKVAQAIACGAAARAGALGIRIQVAVVDAAGLPLAFLGMNGAPLHSAGIAEDKAYTAASFGIATSAWGETLGDNAALARGLAQRQRLVMFAGGLPIQLEGRCVGGVGVSGGSEAEDEDCARVGLGALSAGKASADSQAQTRQMQ